MPAARDDVQVAVVLEAKRREGERGPRDRGADRAEPELAGEEVGARERERVGEEEEHVVAHDRGLRARADQARRRVADQRVRERQRVVERPELVRLEEVERLVRERVTVPGDLPRLHERVAEVLGHVVAEVERQRPVHDDREQARADDEQDQLAAGDLGARRPHRGPQG